MTTAGSNKSLMSMLGKVLGEAYRVDKIIGLGAMSAVFRGTQLNVDRPVAIKIMVSDRAEATGGDVEQALARFRQEAKATSKLRHPNTVRLFDFGETPDGMPYLVLELLEGETIQARLKQVGTLDSLQAAHIGRQVCKSLGEAHSKGIIHRDLKPENVFLCVYDRDVDFVKVTDLGIARLASSAGARLTTDQMMVGSPHYLAPEQAMGGAITPQTDMYSTGIMLYEMLTGTLPFEGDAAHEVARKQVEDPLPPLVIAGASRALVEAWAALLESLCAKSPADRPRSVAEVAESLRVIREMARAELTGSRSAIRAGYRSGTYTASDVRGALRAESKPGAPSKQGGWVWLAAVAAAAVVGFVVGRMTAPSASGEPAPMVDASAPQPSAQATSAPDALAAPRPDAEVAGGAAVATPPETPDASDVAAEPPPSVPMARLILTSDPSGATVYRDRGRSIVCKTPCDLDVEAAEGNENLFIRKRGFARYKLRVGLTAGRTVEYEVELEDQ